MDDPDYEWLMLDASYIKAHPHSAGAGAATKPLPGGLNSKLHMAVDSHGMPVRLAVTAGTVADCSQALPLIEGIKAEHLWRTKPHYASPMDPVIHPAVQRGATRSVVRFWWRTVSWSSQWPESPGMPRSPFLTWPSARFGPWRFGLNYFDDPPSTTAIREFRPVFIGPTGTRGNRRLDLWDPSRSGEVFVLHHTAEPTSDGLDRKQQDYGDKESQCCPPPRRRHKSILCP